ncbi:hypothetical protein RJ639_024383 [Escallonia herrerae]|uniref:Transmembrane protein n=1 Tax=Escallonia herrerae TaxID=1293975 RepID=A0AA88V1W0_9ASTE|nr:hypothetical protein RJ639_024805 [Escallonia herrerae]KAK2999499.1 hypothetical protein RJ639_024383 [Escallonia herrerae]
MVTTSITLSPPPIPSIFSLRPRTYLNAHNSSLSITSHLCFPANISPRRTHLRVPLKSTKIWRTAAEDALLLEASPAGNSEQIVSTADGGFSTIISTLLFLAFLGLSILTLGVIYIAVADFLQKREREKFEKDEAAKKKKGGKKGKVRARAGPRGFGQKVDNNTDDFEI